MIRVYITLLFITFTINLLHAQSNLSTKNKKAIEYYNESDNYRVRGQYKPAVDLLNMALQKDDKFYEAYYRLGLIYLTKKNFPEAIQNFKKFSGILKITDEPAKTRAIQYDLGSSYFACGEYEEATTLLSAFLKSEMMSKPRIDHAKQMLHNIEVVKQNVAVATKYKLKPLSDTVNAYAHQYFPVLTADEQELIFTMRKGNNVNTDLEDIMISRKDNKGRWTTPTSISPNINTASNDGTCSISADGRKLIFTSCVGREGFGGCDIYQSIKVGDEWTEPINLGANVNSVDWDSQPSLSADGRTLYFVSDRRGTLGRGDIWVTYLNEKGEWSKAKNLGKPINTVYDETSPFIHVNNRVLCFASNNLNGFGGSDIFYSERDTTGNWIRPINLGTPINNYQDQYSLFITADGKTGYYSHEETSASGFSTSKIYEIEIPEENRFKHKSNYVKGTVRDKTTKQPLAATIELINIEKNETEYLIKSDSITGAYLFVLTQGAEYALYVNKQGYLFTSENFNYSAVKDFEPIIKDIQLEKFHTGSIAVLNNIFFDTDKFELKEKSKTELQRIVKFLNENPQLKIEISGHTDNVGTPAYNKQLSEKRAHAVYTYMVDNNINPKRLLSLGIGQDQPLAPNDSETNRQLNRRIQFKILK